MIRARSYHSCSLRRRGNGESGSPSRRGRRCTPCWLDHTGHAPNSAAGTLREDGTKTRRQRELRRIESLISFKWFLHIKIVVSITVSLAYTCFSSVHVQILHLNKCGNSVGVLLFFFNKVWNIHSFFFSVKSILGLSDKILTCCK